MIASEVHEGSRVMVDDDKGSLVITFETSLPVAPAVE